MRFLKHVLNFVILAGGAGLVAFGLWMLRIAVFGPIENFSWYPDVPNYEACRKTRNGVAESGADGLPTAEAHRPEKIRNSDAQIFERLQERDYAEMQKERWVPAMLAPLGILLGGGILLLGWLKLPPEKRWSTWDIHWQRMCIRAFAAAAMISALFPWGLERPLSFPGDRPSPYRARELHDSWTIFCCLLPAFCISFVGNLQTPLTRWKRWLAIVPAVVGLVLAIDCAIYFSYTFPSDPFDYAWVRTHPAMSGPYFFLPCALAVCLAGLLCWPRPAR